MPKFEELEWETKSNVVFKITALERKLARGEERDLGAWCSDYYARMENAVLALHFYIIGAGPMSKRDMSRRRIRVWLYRLRRMVPLS